MLTRPMVHGPLLITFQRDGRTRYLLNDQIWLNLAVLCEQHTMQVCEHYYKYEIESYLSEKRE